MAQQLSSDVQDKFVGYLRRNHRQTTQSFACIYCVERRIYQTRDDLWQHFLTSHAEKIPPEAEAGSEALEKFRAEYEAQSLLSKRSLDDTHIRSPIPSNDSPNALPEPQPSQAKRPLASPGGPPGSISELRGLNIETPRESVDIEMQDASDSQGDHPRSAKRAAVGKGISETGSSSPYRERSDSPPRRAKARPTSESDLQRPHVPKPQLWTPEMESPLTRSSFAPSNIASLQASKSRPQNFNSNKSRKPIQQSSQLNTSRQPPMSSAAAVPKPGPVQIFGSKAGTQPVQSPKDETYDIILQPETRPISQEQLVAEVKGIYAGLVMVEAKCIEVDNKQATLAQAEAGAQSKLNNEQWQALIALHRTLLHEHHDFFLASQHPSASPALRRLASKYAMPARMWRHGIHSFLELLRHRLPASLDHMLAFIYLAYSMMALLYETVPAFEDTWIECLGDLGRYRMAIEDDDIRDREVWTGVARHWYSKASDKAPTTGRLYHHLAILARPNALQQLFYYAKSLCVVVPFTSARESILTLFEPVLSADNGQGQYRLPPLDTAFVKSHAILFTNKNMEKFEPTVQEFLDLLDNQIGRVTRKFMEQGYHIAIANHVAMLGFASKDNILMKALYPPKDDTDVQMSGASSNDMSLIMPPFKNAQRLSNATLKIVLQRIGDPNVLPFIHVTLCFMLHMSRNPKTMGLLEADFPWELLSTFLNTLLATYKMSSRIENDTFPLPEKDEVRPFPEDFAMRGLLWTDNLFPESWFTNEKIDEEEKYHELASMTAQRKERILYLGCAIAKSGYGIKFDSTKPAFSSRLEPLASRTPTFASYASASTDFTVNRAATFGTMNEDHSDGED